MRGPDVRKDLFGGRGEVQVWDLLGQAPTPPFTAALACELEPGGNVGAHVQSDYPEIVIGLDGDGSARVNGEVTPLGPGGLVYLPLGATLEIDNLSSEAPLRYLIIKAQGTPAA